MFPAESYFPSGLTHSYIGPGGSEEMVATLWSVSDIKRQIGAFSIIFSILSFNVTAEIF